MSLGTIELPSVAELEQMLDDGNVVHAICAECLPVVDGKPLMLCGVLQTWDEYEPENGAPECKACMETIFCPTCGVRLKPETS